MDDTPIIKIDTSAIAKVMEDRFKEQEKKLEEMLTSKAVTKGLNEPKEKTPQPFDYRNWSNRHPPQLLREAGTRRLLQTQKRRRHRHKNRNPERTKEGNLIQPKGKLRRNHRNRRSILLHTRDMGGQDRARPHLPRKHIPRRVVHELVRRDQGQARGHRKYLPCRTRNLRGPDVR